MAPPTPPGSRVAETVNPYSSKVVIVGIGANKSPFSIHKSKLEQLTSFFGIHGGPLATPSPEQPASATPSEANSEGFFMAHPGENDTPMKTEGGDTGVGEGEDAGEVQRPTVDYAIDDRFHTVGAFKILTAWLYNEPPTTPSNKVQCKYLLQAYVLACLYNAYQLQNLIVDRFRDFHTTYNLDLDNLIWLANRIEDSIACPLTAYFVEQAAFEIADRGFFEFEKANLFLNTFLREGEWEIRLEIFKALAKHAQASGGRLGDPAKSPTQDWHVEVAGEGAGNVKVGARRGIPTRSRRPMGVDD